MIPIMLISFVYGPSIGLFTGFLFGVFKLIVDPYILSPIQVLFDYPYLLWQLELQDALKINI